MESNRATRADPRPSRACASPFPSTSTVVPSRSAATSHSRAHRAHNAHASIDPRARRADAPHRRAQRQRAKQPDVHRVLLDPLRHAGGPILKQPVHHPGAHGGEGVRHRAQSRGDLGHRSRRASSSDVAARSGPIPIDLWVSFNHVFLEGRVFVVERYRSQCTLSRVRTSRVCAISTKPYVYTRLAHIFGHMEFVDVAREFILIHSRPTSTFRVRTRAYRPSSRSRPDRRRRASRSETSSATTRGIERARRARALGIHSIHSFVPAVRRDNSSGRLDLPTRRVDAGER